MLIASIRYLCHLRFALNMRLILNSIFLVFLISIVSSGCKKENLNAQLGIPLIDVDQYVLLNNPSNQSLNAVGGWVYLDAGSRGIVIYHRSFDEFVSFDRHCTYQTQESCGKVSVDSSNIFLSCACCDSRFSLIDGSAINGPTINPLLQYQSQLSAPGILHVWN
jgi:nitrite reductase/ring-hydroxylating ferredoxin subunit